MIYITGDCHREFGRFTRKQRARLPFELTKYDFVIICGDFGLLWADDTEFRYHLEWLSRLPFTLLWVQGNHENYSMIEGFPLEEWHGGMVRHIVRDKIILMERGQIFCIEGKTFFTMGGASSHDISGGILDRNSPTYQRDRKKAKKRGLNYRVLNESWWQQELPSEEELQKGRDNLAAVGYQVDYVISHCASNYIQNILEGCSKNQRLYDQNILTDYFDELESRLDFKHWFFGHYHAERRVDDKHTLLYETIVPLADDYDI